MATYEDILEALEELKEKVEELMENETPEMVEFEGIDNLTRALNTVLTELISDWSDEHGWNEPDEWFTDITVDDEGIHISMCMENWSEFSKEFLKRLNKFV